MKKSFDDLIIIENNESKNRYWADDDEKYISSDKYEKNNENKNE